MPISLRSVLPILLTALLLPVLACLPPSQKFEQLSQFDKTLQAYHNMIKYGQTEEASRFISPKIRANFYPIVEKLIRDQSVSDYFIRRVTMAEEHDKATVVVARDIYNNNTYVVKRETITQEWEKREGGWQLVGGGF